MVFGEVKKGSKKVAGGVKCCFELLFSQTLLLNNPHVFIKFWGGKCLVDKVQVDQNVTEKVARKIKRTYQVKLYGS